MVYSLYNTFYRKPEEFSSFVPAGNTGRKLLIVNPAAGEKEYYTAAGWQVSLLVLDHACAEMCRENKIEFTQTSWYDPWNTLFSFKFNAVMLNRVMSVCADGADFFRRIKLLLSDKARIAVRFKNAEYYQTLLYRSSRDLIPWPDHFPDGAVFQKSDIEALALECRYRLVSIQEKMDPLYYDPNSGKWGNISSFDCRLMLPAGEQERRVHFIKWFDAELENQDSAMEIAQEVLEHVSPDKLHAEVQELLEKNELEKAKSILMSILQDDRADDHTYNLIGVLHFYLNEYDKAYISFQDALELNQLNLDYYYNLYDAAEKIGRQDKVIELIDKSVHLVPGLKTAKAKIISGDR